MGSPSDTGYAALLREVIVAPCLCGRAHIVQPEGVQSKVYFAWRNYISERAPAADTGSSASEHVKVIGKSGCTLLPGELSRSMKQGTTQEQVLQWIEHVAGITDPAVQRQFYELFTAARRPSLQTQDHRASRKRKHAVARLPATDAGSSRSGAEAPEASESASQPAALQCGPCTSLTHLTQCLVCHEISGPEEDCRFQHVRDRHTGVIRESPRPRGCRAPMSSLRVVNDKVAEHILQHVGPPLLRELRRQLLQLEDCNPPIAIQRWTADPARTSCDVCGTSFFTFRCAVPPSRWPTRVTHAPFERS